MPIKSPPADNGASGPRAGGPGASGPAGRATGRVVSVAPGEYPLLLAYAAVAIYGCVPETDQMPKIGAMAVGLLAVEVLTRRPSALVVSVGATLIVLWSGVYGATGRGSAVVGAWFAFWPIVLVAAFTAAFVAAGRALAPITRAAIGLVGAAAAVGVARTGAIEPTIEPALAAVAVAAPASAMIAAGVVAVSRRLGASANRC